MLRAAAGYILLVELAHAVNRGDVRSYPLSRDADYLLVRSRALWDKALETFEAQRERDPNLEELASQRGVVLSRRLAPITPEENGIGHPS